MAGRCGHLQYERRNSHGKFARDCRRVLHGHREHLRQRRGQSRRTWSRRRPALPWVPWHSTRRRQWHPAHFRRHGLGRMVHLCRRIHDATHDRILRRYRTSGYFRRFLNLWQWPLYRVYRPDWFRGRRRNTARRGTLRSGFIGHRFDRQGDLSSDRWNTFGQERLNRLLNRLLRFGFGRLV